MFKYYCRMNHYLRGIAWLLLLPLSTAAVAGPDDSTEVQLLKPISFSPQKEKKSFLLAPSKSQTRLEDKDIADPSGLFSKFLSGLQTGGYYRAYFWGRSMKEPYGGFGAEKVLTVGDGYFDPMLMMYVGGTPTVNTSFGTELILANPFEAYRGPGAGDRTFNTYYTMVLRGNANTKYGNFGVVAGGIEWRQLSPFTFGSNVGYQRYSVWERRPWDPGGNLNTRYASYYHNGTINQDLRFGTRAFKGFILNGYNMPYNTTFDLFYGRTEINAGFDREAIVKPKSNVGFKFTKNFKNNNWLAFNTFNSFVRTDSINSKVDVQWNIFTTEFNYTFKEFNLNGEIGIGGYESPNYKRSWSEGIIVNLVTPKKYTLLPFSLRYFQIGKSFTSNVAQFSNTSIQEVTSGYLAASNNVVLAPFGGNMSGVGDLANNRRGAAINTEVKVWRLKFGIGAQMESELEKLNNQNIVTFGHRINALTWSRIPGIFPYNGGLGPNGRVKTLYRGVYETVNISENTPGDSTPLYRRHYSSLDFQIKFNMKLFNKDLYFYNLNTLMTVQNKFSPIPVMNDNAYIRAQYHEGEVYYQVLRELVLSLYGGLEYVKGNRFTDTTTALTGVNGISGLTRDQLGQAFGIGADVMLSNQTTLYFRHRWFKFADRNFAGENFLGQEATIELKIFF
jgi:hypothetical protein